MKGVIYFVCTVLLLQICCEKTFAQRFPNLQFDHLTVKDGLSSNYVTAITEDKLSFIWIGTANGLNRYDGYRFKQYYHNNTDSNSLINNSVQGIICDTKGRLWISTEDGVSCFVPAENKFVNFSSRLKPPHYLKNNSSVRVYEDAKGTIWLSNQYDVIYRVLSDITLQEVKINLPAFIFYNQFFKGYDNIFRDRSENEWAFKGNRIYSINKASKQPDKTFDFSAVLNAVILKILQDSKGNYFVTTWNNGVWQFIPDKNILKPVTTLPSRVFVDIAEWNYKKEKWITCLETNFGLYLLDPKSLGIKKYGFIPGDPSSIQGNIFNLSFIDKKGNLWIGSNRGINKITAEQNIFDIIPVTEPGATNYNFLKTGTVYSFFETDSSIWLSKRFVSTFEYDTAFHLKYSYNRLYPLSSSDYSNNGFAYYFFKKQNELFITTDSGLVVYDLLKKISNIYFPPQCPYPLSLRTIITLNENEIMIRSFEAGLFVFNTATKIFTNHFANTDVCNGCLPHRINYLFKTKQNEIFVSTSGEAKGLFKYRQQLEDFVPVKAINDEKYSMQASDLYGMDEDKEGNLWITSSSGLFIYNPTGNTILQQNNDNEQIGSLSRICFDDNGNAWANGNSGIWCYLLARKKWVSFNSQDGLPGSVYEGIITKKRNGDIVAGLEGAVAIFHPQKLTESLNDYPVVITEASVENNFFSFTLNSGANKKLTIHPGQNSFSVDFAILNYLNPASSHYYYKLSPLMKDFQLNDNGHINFNGLSPGHYTLHVKAGDKAGNIFDKEDILEINVEPGWYQTNWFKALCLLALAAIVFYFVRKRITTIKKEASFKQKIAETEMQALRAQMNPHFIFNSLNSIENFIMQNEKRLASDYLNKFSSLIRSILDSSSNEVIPIAKDMEALQLYIDLEQLRFNNKFTYKTNIDHALLTGEYRVPSLLIQPYVENAIVHGIANSYDEKLQLSITVTLEENNIKYTIQDNGVGRRHAAEYNAQNKPQHKSIGLKITENRIAHFNKKELLHDDVQITDLYDENNEPAGTKVEIKIRMV